MELDQIFVNNVIKEYPKNKDIILQAYQFANDAHEGLYRKSGEPYIIHPVAVAQILIDNKMDAPTIIAGLLHDVVEDTKYTLDDIEKLFGATVRKLVDGVTKINEMNLKSHRYGEAESIKHLLIAMGDDVRVIFIKLADRLHNMKTIGFLPREKQIRMAKETQELFIPIAERIGVRNIRSELESLVFKCNHPEEYVKIKTELTRKLTKHKVQLEDIEKKITKVLNVGGIKSKINGWPERTYSIYKKESKTQGIGKIYCLMLFKVIVASEEDCYKSLGLIHKTFSPLPGQVKDYIASPKPNGYQSLHSIVVSKDSGITFKVMIRTEKMNKVCEYGIASAWQGRDIDSQYDVNFEKLNKLKNIISGENVRLSTTSLFIDAIKTDLTPDVTWVLTPKLKPICVAAENPTALDFAYAVHTKIGNNAVGAMINGKKASLKSTLKGGDVVQILTTEEDKAPSRNWLGVVKTALARKKIREYINHNITEENIEKGKEILKAALEKQNMTLAEFEPHADKLNQEYNFVSLDDLYASIGYKSITINAVLGCIKNVKECAAKNTCLPIKCDGKYQIENLFFPKCCCPIYGDEIIGVTSRNGLTIHTKECVNLNSFDKDKLVEVFWQKQEGMSYDVNLKITAKNTMGLAAKLLKVIAENNYDLSKLTAKKTSESSCEFYVCFSVTGLSELEDIVKKIKTVSEVKTVSRYFD